MANQNEAYLLNTTDFSITKLIVPGGTISGLAADKNNGIYISIITGGIFKSIDNGNTWNFYDKPTVNLDCRDFKIDKDDIIYVKAKSIYPWQEDGIYRSKDYGRHWDLLFPVDSARGYPTLLNINGNVFLKKDFEKKLCRSE